jgi:hypothetical protein
LGLFITRAFREMGKQEDAVRTREDLQLRFEQASAGQTVIPDWLQPEAEKELKE